jgi:hypothetical protein
MSIALQVPSSAGILAWLDYRKASLEDLSRMLHTPKGILERAMKHGEAGWARIPRAYKLFSELYAADPLPDNYVMRYRQLCPPVVVEAVQSVWDGTEEHALCIARVVLALRGLYAIAIKPED